MWKMSASLSGLKDTCPYRIAIDILASLSWRNWCRNLKQATFTALYIIHISLLIPQVINLTLAKRP
jgi:hypothetical protein